MSFSGKKLVVSLTFPLVEDQLWPHSHTLLFCSLERSAQGSPAASGWDSWIPESLTQASHKDQKVGCCLPTLRGKQATNTGRWIYNLSEDWLAACLGNPGHRPVPTSPSPQQGVSQSLSSYSLSDFPFPILSSFSSSLLSVSPPFTPTPFSLSLFLPVFFLPSFPLPLSLSVNGNIMKTSIKIYMSPASASLQLSRWPM